MKLSFAMVGAAGRMGRSIIAASQNAVKVNMVLCGALEREDCPALGEDAGPLAGIDNLGVSLSANISESLGGAQVVIDFSSPETSLQTAEFCRKKRIPCVIGTTGFTQEQTKTISLAAKDIPLLIASNMSLGMNVLFYIARQSALFLGTEFDAEIWETHHRYKKDAPSGTALSLCEALKTSPAYKNHNTKHGRQGITGERPREEIGVHALRGGDSAGEHTVFFMGEGERLELTHRASSRKAFAAGALRAAVFLAEKKTLAKMYTMNDVLGLNSVF